MNPPALLVLRDSICTLLSPKINTVSVNSSFFSGQQFCRHRHVMYVCANYFHMIHKATIVVYADMGLSFILHKTCSALHVFGAVLP